MIKSLECHANNLDFNLELWICIDLSEIPGFATTQSRDLEQLSLTPGCSVVPSLSHPGEKL